MEKRKIPDRARKRFSPSGPPNLFVDELAAFVRTRRRANGLPQSDLADLAGVSQRFIADLEARKPTLRLSHVLAVLAVFGKTLGIAALLADQAGEIDS